MQPRRCYLHPEMIFLALLGVLGFSACGSNPPHKRDVFLQNMPAWMVEDRSMFVTQGIDSSHVIDGQVERSEGIARERARFRVAEHIANKIKEIYTKDQNADQKSYDSEVFSEITQAIAASFDKWVQLGEYINPNNQEVFMLMRVDGYSSGVLQDRLEKIESLSTQTIKDIMQSVKTIFKEAIDYGDIKVPQSM
ncbi:hypothetical protein [Helicobacter suis]|uniref:hypothetical protein n=1 Tax=Helicobacter suis TaxID=104628 RepID=UPI0013D45AC5|nr:hypothetical protein [Helicobacter suis]